MVSECGLRQALHLRQRRQPSACKLPMVFPSFCQGLSQGAEIIKVFRWLSDASPGDAGRETQRRIRDLGPAGIAAATTVLTEI